MTLYFLTNDNYDVCFIAYEANQDALALAAKEHGINVADYEVHAVWEDVPAEYTQKPFFRADTAERLFEDEILEKVTSDMVMDGDWYECGNVDEAVENCLKDQDYLFTEVNDFDTLEANADFLISGEPLYQAYRYNEQKRIFGFC